MLDFVVYIAKKSVIKRILLLSYEAGAYAGISFRGHVLRKEMQGAMLKK